MAPIGDRFDMVFKGTAVVQGVGRAVVTGTGMRTEMGAIAEMLDETEAVDSPLQKEIASVSRALGVIVIGIAVVVMVAIAVVNGVDTPDDVVTILLMGVSLAVAAVPEGLPAILSLVLAIGVRELAQRNAVMKNLHSVETLGSASVICSDKTGTLTRNEMTLRTVVTASGEVELTGTGYRPEGEALLRGRPPRTPSCSRRGASSSAGSWRTTPSSLRSTASGGSRATHRSGVPGRPAQARGRRRPGRPGTSDRPRCRSPPSAR